MKVEGPGQTISSNALGGNELVWLYGWRGFCPCPLCSTAKTVTAGQTGKLGRSAAEPFPSLLGDVGSGLLVRCSI